MIIKKNACKNSHFEIFSKLDKSIQFFSAESNIVRLRRCAVKSIISAMR